MYCILKCGDINGWSCQIHIQKPEKVKKKLCNQRWLLRNGYDCRLLAKISKKIFFASSKFHKDSELIIKINLLPLTYCHRWFLHCHS